MSDRFTLLGVGALVVVVSTAACSNLQLDHSNSNAADGPPGAITKLEIEIDGGFAYIPSPNDNDTPTSTA